MVQHGSQTSAEASMKTSMYTLPLLYNYQGLNKRNAIVTTDSIFFAW